MGRGRGASATDPTRGASPRPADRPAAVWERGSEQERIEFLSFGLAYEARVLEAHVSGYRRVPKGIAHATAGSADRLRQAALGEAERVYLHGVTSSRASDAMNRVLEADPDPAALVHFSDAENALRLAFAGEAAEIERMLEFAGFPSGRRRYAIEQLERMRAVAAGHYEQGYAATNRRSFEGALADLRSRPTAAG